MLTAQHHGRRLALATLALLAIFIPRASEAADPKPGPPLTIQRAAGPITVDGDLLDPGWQGVTPITTWYETHVGDNVEPAVKNVAYLTYDDHYLYAGFRFEDPHPEQIRAPIGDHDAVPSSTDYAGVIVDSRDDGKTAQMFLANPNGVQYDAVTSDATGEDSSPDFYWDAVGKITATGWTLEIRIPFSSLRYTQQARPEWGILLYRNYPRDRRYQIFSARLPRDVNCFICNSSKLTGLDQLPRDEHLVVAPYAATQRSDAPTAGVLGNRLDDVTAKSNVGGDLKWSPSPAAAIDATVNPDFSQVESDVAQIAANERFALFYPEKRPFFLEGVDLFATPFQAVYTRTVTSPDAGVRATGRFGNTSYTALATRDRGGGVVIIPGAEGSYADPQDFQSEVGVVRIRHDLGTSFASFLATGREIEGGGHNYVFGPDFQWRPKPSDSFTGQGLWSDTRTPNRTDIDPAWNGGSLSDGAAVLNWSHNTPRVDWFVQGMSLGQNFRADEGFIPQVGYREGYFEPGYTIRPEKQFFSRVRIFTIDWEDQLPDGRLLARRISVGSGGDGKWNSFTRVELNRDEYRVGTAVLERFRPRVYFESSPGRFVNFYSIDTYFGDEIDFANARRASGATVIATATIRPSDHLELRCDGSGRWLNVDAGNGLSGRLFSAEIGRLRATYSFNARSFARLIGQYDQVTRDTTLYTFAVNPKDADFSASALFAYKLNWQTVLYAGYGDDRQFDETTQRFQKSGRQVFAKVSYAYQQ